MTRFLITAVGLYHAVNAISMWIDPQRWYHLVPGVAQLGPFNSHFIRDAALAFAVSSFALLWGLARGDRTALLGGTAWPLAHAVFHGWLWMTRGAPLDSVAALNLLGIQLPAWAAFVSALLHQAEAREHA